MGDAERTLLVVAGHDPSGAGVDADREAAESLGVRARLVVTARTEQDDHGVYAVGARPPNEWLGEARAALAEDPSIAALKLGLLPGVDHVRAALELVRELPGLPVVVDPVISASSGRRFLFARAVDVLARELCAAPAIVTPNLPEAAELTGVPLATLLADGPAVGGAREAAARVLTDRGAAAVVLKGGHGAEDPVVDLLVPRDSPALALRRARVLTSAGAAGIRGSGCRFASRLAAALGLGRPLEEAARGAGEWVAARIADAALVPPDSSRT